MNREIFIRWLWVVLFAVAFAWVESAVVVYLRKIFFDGSFSFPLIISRVAGKRVVDPLVYIEFGREIATIIMLIAIGRLSGSDRLQRFCFFMIAFGVWDIFYYIWLYVMTGWPASLMTWDLLFYVPLPWVGPVITPLMVAMAMTAGGSLLIFYQQKGYPVHWRWRDTAVECCCGLLMIVAFCWDWKNILQVPGDIPRSGIPNPFLWRLFLPAYLTAVIYFAARLRQMLHAPANSR